MTRQEILESYSVNDRAVICSPGKFEGERIWAPAVYDIVQNGFAETLDWPEGVAIDIVDCDDELRTMFPEIGADTVAFSVEYSDSGFVYVTRLTAAELDSVSKQNERAWENSAERRNADRIDGYDRDDLGESPDY